jgi:hypothetical protein
LGRCRCSKPQSRGVLVLVLVLVTVLGRDKCQ